MYFIAITKSRPKANKGTREKNSKRKKTTTKNFLTNKGNTGENMLPQDI